MFTCLFSYLFIVSRKSALSFSYLSVFRLSFIIFAFVLTQGESVVFERRGTPWSVAADLAFPCAKENEIGEEAAVLMCKNGCRVVIEGANMPLTPKAIEVFTKNNVIVCPAKAANAGTSHHIPIKKKTKRYPNFLLNSPSLVFIRKQSAAFCSC